VASHHSLLSYCRAGFEGEAAAELAARGGALGGHVRAVPGSGLVELVLPDAPALDRAAAAIAWRDLVFSRQLLACFARLRGLPANDRLAVLLPPILEQSRAYCDAWIETPDTEAAKTLAPLCRSLNAALVARLRRDGLLDRASPLRLHLCLAEGGDAWIAQADTAHSAPWPGGIPRLRFPRGAPSRSTLKLEEAFLVLLDPDERARWLQPGLRAVDLGAAPGGWTWQLVARSLHVTAVDNGPMDARLLDSGLVDHLRADGFRYRPSRPVDWLVCDMVEQPRRVAALMAQWLAQGWCRQAVFNLKLPMKKRHEEVERCLAVLREGAGRDLLLRARQLYHDREEITVFARVRASAPAAGARPRAAARRPR
jgi:23S rRNA (cytidine2498-2'-O)-methyltransferase